MSTAHMDWLAHGMRRWNTPRVGDVNSMEDLLFQPAADRIELDPEPRVVVIHDPNDPESIDAAKQRLRLARLGARTSAAEADSAREVARHARQDARKARAEMDAARHAAALEAARLRGSKARKDRSYEEAETLDETSGVPYMERSAAREFAEQVGASRVENNRTTVLAEGDADTARYASYVASRYGVRVTVERAGNQIRYTFRPARDESSGYASDCPFGFCPDIGI